MKISLNSAIKEESNSDYSSESANQINKSNSSSSIEIDKVNTDIITI